MISSLFADGSLSNVDNIEVEPEFGYAVRITYKTGGVRITRGNDVGLNTGSATEVAKDKAYTKYFLQRSGFSVPRGDSFLASWWAQRLRPAADMRGAPPFREATQIVSYARDSLQLPVYVKPVDGSKGANVWLCPSLEAVAKAVQVLEADHVRVILVEEDVKFPDFRLVVLRGDIISIYGRTPLAVVGDGVSTVAQLLAQLQDSYRATGRDTVLQADDVRISARLQHIGMSWQDVLPVGASLRLHDISNLSAGGTAVDYTDSAATRWKELALNAARALGLQFCGVDLACQRIDEPDGDYAILELNATPGLDHYGAIGDGQEAVVRALYARVLNAPLE